MKYYRDSETHMKKIANRRENKTCLPRILMPNRILTNTYAEYQLIDMNKRKNRATPLLEFVKSTKIHKYTTYQTYKY